MSATGSPHQEGSRYAAENYSCMPIDTHMNIAWRLHKIQSMGAHATG